MIAQFVGTNQRNWDKQVPEFAIAYNTAKHDATEFSPEYFNYGREIQPPSLVRSRAEQGKSEMYDPHRAAKTLEDTMELVKVNLAQAYEKQAKYYNRKRGSWQPAPGDLVSKREHHLSSAIDNFSAKLAEKFATGFTVTKVVGPSVYEVTKEGKTFTAHLKDLKPFHEGNPLKPDRDLLDHEQLDRDHEQTEPELDETLQPRRITRAMARKANSPPITEDPD
ncbi:uncharacterized protein LOC130670441 [Microplitis mediator]|uniref:uncharacterized protein LOC130670441 n=1 Tax=Microplitis mediator TaxID=375433 RepID=UPI0025567C58|nr:uncharacterized protein LOC130670441 [Microplitis mediator]